MSVERYGIEHYHDQGSEITEQANGEYVRYEDFAQVLLAVRTIYKTCDIFMGRNPDDTTAAAIRNHLQKIVDQYE